jgi:crotonobetainyl-CoA:carnitine CoA-transferase CaiB-like acyl-CoA transferase
MATDKVLAWPAVPIPKPEEVYAGLSDQAKEYPMFLEAICRQEHNFEKPEALSKLRVLDCTTGMMIGHWCSSMLSELGAEVIMVEPPGGDPLRQLTPFGRREYMFKDKESGEEVGGQFLHECRNKFSVTLNLETEEGREVLKQMAVHADVLIENAPPGKFDSLGIGYRQLSELNKRLVYCWVGQRGQWGPLKDKEGMLDPIAQSACGFVHGTGDPKEFGGTPMRSALWMADHVGGTTAAMGILAAVFHRDTVSHEGQFVEATSAESIIRILDYSWAWHSMDGSIRPRFGNWDLAINIYAVNPCKDGYMMVGGGHDRLWYRIWRVVGDEYPKVEDEILGDPHLREVADRLAMNQQIKTYTLLCEWLKDNSRSEAEAKLSKQQVASGGVQYVDEVAEFPHFKYRQHLAETESPHYGKVLYGTTPFQQVKTPGRLKWLGRPTGYDNQDVYRRLLGFTSEDFTRLKEAGVI